MNRELKSTNEQGKFLKRTELAARWRCSVETIKRRQRSGLLNPVRLSQRSLLYLMSEIEQIEREAQSEVKEVGARR
jgi:hypothetical protein